MENKKSFSWSFKPLVLIANISSWILLNFSTRKTSSLTRILVMVFLGSLSLLSHLIINGPRSINIANFDWMYMTQDFNSSNEFLKHLPDAKLQLAVDATQISFFVAFLLIHFVLIITVIAQTRKWKRLIRILKKIQKEMNLGDEFYEKCRKYCIIAILFLLGVNFQILKILFKSKFCLFRIFISELFGFQI